MQAITLIVQKEIRFTNIAGVEKLVLDNPTPVKLAVKIRTNHKTALQIHPTHDFIEAHSKKEVVVKLLESHQGVKLQVNYCIATEEMIASNDSKMGNIDKKNIKKEIIVINVNDVQIGDNSLKSSQGNVESDFMSVVPQKTESKNIEKKLSLNQTKKETENMIVVEQKLEEDEEQYEQKQRKLTQKIADLDKRIRSKRENILNKRQQSMQAIESSSIIPQYTIPLVLIGAYLLGTLIKSIIF